MITRWAIRCACLLVSAGVCFGGGVPTWVQEHYRWRNDDGSESTAGWKAATDTTITNQARYQNIRLRFVIANTGAASGTVTPQLEFSASTNGPWTALSTETNGATAFEMTTTAGYADGDASTAQLTGTGSWVAGKVVEKPSNKTVAAITVNTNAHTEAEYCLRATAKAAGGMPYYFRTSNAGSILNTYTKIAQLTMAPGEANEAPQIVSSLSAQASTQAPFSYKLLASGTEPITLSASGFPAGLGFDGTASITGTATASGSFSIGLSATSAYGADNKTLALTVLANVAPVASNQSASVVQGGESLITLAWSDVDNPLLTDHTFTIVGQPAHGTLESYNQRNGTTAYPNQFYFRAATNFTGTDSFTWKCRDKEADSNVATATVVVSANTAPVATSGSMSVYSSQRSSVYLNTTHTDAGQALTYELVGSPLHGTVEWCPAGGWYYTSAKDYVGSDSFTWRCSDGMANSGTATMTITVNAYAPYPSDQSVYILPNTATNIPASYYGGGGYIYYLQVTRNVSHGTLVITNGSTFRYMPAAGYTGSDSFDWQIRYGLTSATSVSSVVTCSILVKNVSADWPVFRGDAYRSGCTLTSLPANLCLQWKRQFQYKLDNGNTTRGGSIAPYEVVAEGKTAIFGGNNRDCVWAIDTDTGAMKWRYVADGPIRTVPAIVGGKVFAGSDDGWFYCFDASNGSLLWKRRGGPSNRKVMGDRRLVSVWPSRCGVLPAGGNMHFVAGLWPVEGIFVYSLDPATGNVSWLNDSAGAKPVIMPHDGVAVGGVAAQGYTAQKGSNSDRMYVPASWAMPAELSVSTGAMEPWYQEKHAGSPNVKFDGIISSWPISVVTPARTYTTTDASALGVSGSPVSMSAADGKLFVVTSTGMIWCYGGTQVTNPTTWADNTTPLVDGGDAWNTRVTTILSTSAATHGVCLVLGVGDGRVVEELVRQGPLTMHIVAVDPDVGKVGALRSKFDDAKVYGTRVSVHVGDPMDFGLPPYVGRLIVSADPVAAGFNNGTAFVRNIFNSTRPYGGSSWLFTSAEQHTSLSGWVAGSGITNAALARSGEFSVLTRNGALPGSVDIKAGSTITNYDENVYGPFGVLWFDADNSSMTDGGHWGTDMPDLAGGYIIGSSGIAVDTYTGFDVPVQTYSSASKSINISKLPADYSRSPLFTGLSDIWTTYPNGHGCGGGPDYGNMPCWRSGNASYSDRKAGNRHVKIATLRSGCNGGDHMFPANGVFAIPGVGGCSCAYSMTKKAVTFVHRDDVEVWDFWGRARWQKGLESDPVKGIGINLGAPAERVDTNGTLWISQPGGISYGNPNCSAMFEPVMPTLFYHHMSRIVSGPSPAWVAASGVKGVTKITVPVAWPVVAQTCFPAPVVDGALYESCWDGQSPVNLVYETFNGQWLGSGSLNAYRPLRYSGRVQARYDSQSLYFGCEMLNGCSFDPSRDGGQMWTIYVSDRSKVLSCGADRSLRFSLMYDGHREGALMTYKGQQTVSYYEGDKTWSGIWQGAITATTNSFAAEFAVPWATLVAEGFDTNNLIINIKGPRSLVLRWDSSYGIDNQSFSGRYTPLSLGTPSGLLASSRPYTVRLHFAETEGAGFGERVFDVKLNGSTVLSDLDVFQATGGANISMVREFPNTMIGSSLDVEFVPKAGQAMISGIELLGDFAYGNHDPELDVYTASPITVMAGANQELAVRRLSAMDVDGDSLAFTWKLDGVAITNGVGSDTWRASTWTYRPTLTNIGWHTVTTTASDGKGGTSTYKWDIYVSGSNLPPLINSDLSVQCVAGTPFTYLMSAISQTNAYFSVAGMPAWMSFDGTNMLRGIVPVSGTVNVDITATNIFGSDTKTLVLSIQPNQLPVVMLTSWPPYGAATLSVKFDATASFDPDGTIQRWWWNYGDGRNSESWPWGGSPSNQTVTYASTGTFTATLYVYDNSGGVGTGCVTVTVLPAGSNTPPTAASQTITVTQNVARAMTLSATDPNSGTVLTYQVLDLPQHGTLNMLTNKNLTYTPATNYCGADSFTFKANDGKVDSNIATVRLNVVDPDADKDGMLDSWEVQKFGSTNSISGAPDADADADGMTNMQEYRAGTDPTNRLSLLAVSQISQTVATNVVLKWSSVSGKKYRICAASNLLDGFVEMVRTNIAATTPMNTSTVSVGQAGCKFYRIRLE